MVVEQRKDDDDYLFSKRIYISTLGVCTLTILFFAVVIYRVAKRIKCNDPIFLFMLCLLQSSMIVSLFYYGWQISNLDEY